MNNSTYKKYIKIDIYSLNITDIPIFSITVAFIDIINFFTNKLLPIKIVLAQFLFLIKHKLKYIRILQFLQIVS